MPKPVPIDIEPTPVPNPPPGPTQRPPPFGGGGPGPPPGHGPGNIGNGPPGIGGIGGGVPRPPSNPKPPAPHLSAEEWARKFPGVPYPYGPPPEPEPTGGHGGKPVVPGGGGGGGGGVAPPGYAPPPSTGGSGGGGIDGPGQNISNLISKSLKGILGGATSFSDDVVNQMKGQTLSAVRGQENANVDALNEDLAGRGLFRSGIAAEGANQIHMKASAEYTGGVREILIKKATQDFQDRKDAIDRAQVWLNSMRDNIIQTERNDIMREQGLAQIQLGYANLANALKIAQGTWANNISVAHINGAGGGGGSPYYSVPGAGGTLIPRN